MKLLDLGEHHVTLPQRSFASPLIYLPDCIFLKPLRTGVTYAWDIKRQLPFHTGLLPLSFLLCLTFFILNDIITNRYSLHFFTHNFSQDSISLTNYGNSDMNQWRLVYEQHLVAFYFLNNFYLRGLLWQIWPGQSLLPLVPFDFT